MTRRPAGATTGMIAAAAALVVLAALAPIALRRAVSAPAGAANGVPSWVLTQTWTEVRSEHFTVITNAGGRVATGVARRLEQFRAAIAVARPELRADPALPTDVFVFRDRASMNAFQMDEAEHLAGFATPGLLRNVMLLSTEADVEGISRVLCHEAVHVFTAASIPSVPLWLDEGLAEYYATFRPQEATFEVGHRRPRFIEWLQHNELAELDLLFAATPQSPVYLNPNPLRATLYAQSWIMARYLQDLSEPAFRRFLDQLRSGIGVRAAFEVVSPRPEWPVWLDRVRRYGRDDFLDFRTLAYTPPRATSPKSRALSPSEVLFRLGELVDDLDTKAPRAAMAWYLATLERDSLQANAWARLGYAAERAGDTAHAESAYRRALTLAPDAFVPNVLAGIGAVSRAQRMAQDEDLDLTVARAWLATGRERVTRGLHRSPDHPVALAAFGASHLPDAEIPQPALRALERASAELPSRRDIAEDLQRARGLRARWAWGPPPERAPSPSPATSRARPSSPAPAPSPAAMAQAARDAEREAEFQARMSRAWRAAAKGDREGFVNGLVRARVMTSDVAKIDSMIAVERAALRLDRARRLATAGSLAAARDTAAAMRGLPPSHELMQAGRELEAELTARLEIDRALALAKAGDVSGARAAFEAVSRMPVDESIRGYARQRIKDLDARR